MLFKKAVEKLEVMHKRGIMHGDVKPDNLMMGLGTSSQDLYFVDFGLAQ